MPLSSGEYCLHQDRWCPPTSVHGGTIQKDKCKSSIVNSLFCTNGLLLYTYRPCMYKWPAAVHISHDRQDSLFLLTLVPTQVTRMEETNNAYTISIGIRKKCKRRPESNGKFCSTLHTVPTLHRVVSTCLANSRRFSESSGKFCSTLHTVPTLHSVVSTYFANSRRFSPPDSVE